MVWDGMEWTGFCLLIEAQEFGIIYQGLAIVCMLYLPYLDETLIGDLVHLT